MSRKTIASHPPLNPRQLAALKSASPNANDIITHLDAFNQEIATQAEVDGVELAAGPEAPPEPSSTPAPTQEVQTVSSANHTDLEAEQARLDALLEEQRARQVAEQKAAAAEPVKEELSIEEQVIQMLRSLPNAPTEAQIAAWKQQFGQSGVQVMALGDEDVYVFTYLRRRQLQTIQQATVKQSQIEGMAKDPDEYMAEQVLKQCVLWPKLDVAFWYNSRAGVIPTLYQSVMLHSYHLTPQQAMVLTAQL